MIKKNAIPNVYTSSLLEKIKEFIMAFSNEYDLKVRNCKHFCLQLLNEICGANDIQDLKAKLKKIDEKVAGEHAGLIGKVMARTISY